MTLVLIGITLLSSKSRCHAEDIINIGIRTDSYSVSGSVGNVSLTLWFDFTIYGCILYPTSKNTKYSCDSSEITVIGSDCDSSDTKLLIDNSASANGVVIANLFITTDNGVLYGIEDVCINDESTKGVWYNNVIVTDNHDCASSYSQYSAICVDNEVVGANSCGPGKQLIYFDRNKPNNFIKNALWSDGTDIEIDIRSCAPTINPTPSPTSRMRSTRIWSTNSTAQHHKMIAQNTPLNNATLYLIIGIIVIFVIAIIGIGLFVHKRKMAKSMQDLKSENKQKPKAIGIDDARYESMMTEQMNTENINDADIAENNNVMDNKSGDGEYVLSNAVTTNGNGRSIDNVNLLADH